MHSVDDEWKFESWNFEFMRFKTSVSVRVSTAKLESIGPECS